MNRLTAICTGLICAGALMLIAQSITPEYMTWPLEKLQEKYADLLTENSKLKIKIAALTKQLAEKPQAEPAQTAQAVQAPESRSSGQRNAAPIVGADALDNETDKFLSDPGKLLIGRTAIFDGDNCSWSQSPGSTDWKFIAHVKTNITNRRIFVVGTTPKKLPQDSGIFTITGVIGEIDSIYRRGTSDVDITVRIGKIIDWKISK